MTQQEYDKEAEEFASNPLIIKSIMKGYDKGWNDAIDSGIAKVNELMFAADPVFGVALYAVINELKALKK